MAGKVRHLINRSGRYHARLVVPKDLRGIVGKTELRASLGGDYREALKHLPGAVAQLQHKIALAEQKAGGANANAPARYPLAPDQIAHSHYMQRMAFDDELRNDPRYAAVGIDDLLVSRLREAVAGKSNDAELGALVGAQIERFRSAGNLDAEPGSPEWREIARALCHAELEALARAAERDEGDFTGQPATPLIVEAQPPESAAAPVSLSGLWADYVEVRKQAGFLRDGGRRQRPVIEGLRKFLKHDDAARITKKDLLAWRDHLMKTKSAKTVSDVDLSTVRTLLNWAVENDRLPENVAATVKQPKPRKVYSRERGYTQDEALKVLKASRAYEPNADQNGYVREKPQLVAAKRWVPIICAFTGARVSEITQLRKEDIRKIDGHWIARITPDAGTVKAGGYRDVPLHRQVIDQGFIDFVQGKNDGPLFHNGDDPAKYSQKAAQTSNQLADWLRKNELRPEGMQPNHAWRHRLKTQCRELGISDRVVDAIQGHAGKTASDDYGDVTLKTKIDAINRLIEYEI
ncbi:site-specific integrase [Shimia thalassica]|uniref:site-specific integrase n=1 Tax=Shimia thalassica TaxID=1715693 RepID=UPI0026E1C9AA|nr:site-specific integrase [Shimia thalassica]MDO6483089.1 site-specific integrase [Shimia thalassica]